MHLLPLLLGVPGDLLLLHRQRGRMSVVRLKAAQRLIASVRANLTEQVASRLTSSAMRAALAAASAACATALARATTCFRCFFSVTIVSFIKRPHAANSSNASLVPPS